MIAIVDYGLGNVQAFANVYRHANVPACIVRDAHALREAERIILPGVGAFDHAMRLLDASGMRQALDEQVLQRGVPVLGVCVGMQIMAEGSDEGQLPGLGWIAGRVRSLRTLPGAAALPQPHMGWNDVSAANSAAGAHALFAGLEHGARFYFLHSYYFECTDAAHRAADAHYGSDFACAVRKGRAWGVQFHPEKSHHWGDALLRNFAHV